MLRLRQIVFVATDLEPAVADLGAALGADVVYTDPGVAEFGLHNALFLVGDQFVEIVAPTTDGTTAGRLLDKRGGNGGYMVILQTDDLAALEQRFADVSARVVFDARTEGADGSTIRGLHLHPKDVGGAILSIDQCDPADRWPWAGDDWGEHDAATTVKAISGVTIQAEHPILTGERWAEVLGVTSRPTSDGCAIDLDDASIHFVPISTDRGEGISGYRFRCADGVGPLDTSVQGVRFVRS